MNPAANATTHATTHAATNVQRRRAIEAMGIGPVWVRRGAVPPGADVISPDRRPGIDATRESEFRVVGVGVERPVCLVIADPALIDDPRFGAPTGRLLDAMLASIGRSRAVDARIVAVVRGPGSASTSSFADGWRAALEHHVATLAPKVIVVVGTEAASMLGGRDDAATHGTGRTLAIDGREIPMVVTCDPARLIDRGTDKAAAWRDLCHVRELCESVASEPAR